MSLRRPLLILLASLLPVYTVSGSDYLDVRLGGFYPKDPAEFSFFGGLSYGFYFDEVVSWNFDGNYYNTTYEEKVTVDNTSLGESAVDKQVSANLFIFQTNVRVDIPYRIAELITPWVQIGLGYDLMYNSYSDATSSNIDLMGGFGMTFSTGMNLPLGSRTAFISQLGYNLATVSSYERRSSGYIEKIDVGGLYLQVGISFNLTDAGAEKKDH